MQGFLFGRPMAAEEIDAVLATEAENRL
jgi:hypothetical protein